MMSLELQIALYTTINILSLFILNSAISIFLKPKESLNLFVKILSYFVFLIFGYVTYFLDTGPAVNILIQFFTVLLIITLYYGKIINKITLSMSWLLFVVLCEFMVGMLYSIVLDTSLKSVMKNELSQLIGTILTRTISLILIKLLQAYKIKKKAIGKFLLFDSFQVAIIPICSIFIMYALDYVAYKDIGVIQWFIVASLICLVFINIFVYYFFDKLRETERIKYKNKLLKSQMDYYIEQEKTLNSTFEKVRIIKHNLSHQMLYLKAKLEEQTEESLQELSNKIDSLIGEDLSEDIKLYTKNQNINRLLNYKLSQAHKSDISIDIKVNIGEGAYIDENSLYIILGNAIDNAIQNYNDSGSSQKGIAIRIFDDNDNLFIKISNPFVGNIKFKNCIPATKKKDISMHGIGLKSVKKLVQDKNGYFKITTSDNIFCLEILLYDAIKNK